MSLQNGEIIGYVGPMKSGKSAKLIEIASRNETLGLTTLAFYPEIDCRCHPDTIQSRHGTNSPAFPVSCTNPEDVLWMVSQEKQRVHTVIFDEMQFFAPEYSDAIQDLANSDIKVIYGGLLHDFRGEFFPVVKNLLSRSDRVHSLSAHCDYRINGHNCNRPATKTQRLINGQPAPYDSPIIVVDSPNTSVTYEARCTNHWIVPGLPETRKFF